jgi:hypothetical protein
MASNRNGVHALAGVLQTRNGADGGRGGRGQAAQKTAGAPRNHAHDSGAGAENLAPAQLGGSAPAAVADAQAGGAGSGLPVQTLSVDDEAWFRQRGRHSGHKAKSAELKGEDVDFNPPEEVTEEGPEAVKVWRAGFTSVFESVPDKSPAGIPVISSKKRKSKEADEPLEGRAGLDSAPAKAGLSQCVYDFVRRHLFLPKDDCKKTVDTWLKAKGYTYTPEEYDAWWLTYGHDAANKKGIAARASVVAKIKDAIWREYSASHTRRVA